MTDIDPKAIDAAVKAMNSISGMSPNARTYRIYRVEHNSGSSHLLEEFDDRPAQDRALVRIKARVAIEAYLEFEREKEETSL